jgi:hypothetical protein
LELFCLLLVSLAFLLFGTITYSDHLSATPTITHRQFHVRRDIARDAVPDGTDAAELFDVEMDELAGLLAFIAIDRFGRLQGTELVQSKPTQNAADGGW